MREGCEEVGVISVKRVWLVGVCGGDECKERGCEGCGEELEECDASL